MLEESSKELLETFPNLEIISLSADYQAGLSRLNVDEHKPKLILWLGSSIGNLHRREAAQFLSNLVHSSSEDDLFLIGIDLQKDKAILEAAYDDSQEVTAAFNLNLLKRINKELGGDFNLHDFKHLAIFNEEEGRAEMHLKTLVDTKIRIDSLDLNIHFSKGETIHTENSYKYTFNQIDQLAARSGLVFVDQWLDNDKRFSLNLFKRR
jgi:dimethylhistidine N-methyltransferase